MDDSNSLKHFVCIWKLCKFYGKEILCWKFTSGKAFLLSITGLRFSTLAMSNRHGILLLVPPGIAHGIWWLSMTTFCMEVWDILHRVIFHYKVYFPGNNPV